MPSRPQRFRRGDTAVGSYIRSCSSRDGARKALTYGFDRHKPELADNLPLLVGLAAEFGDELPPFAWIHRRIKELS